MSSKYLKPIIMTTAAAIGISLGAWSPASAAAPAAQTAGTNDGGVPSSLHASRAVSSNLHIAMMDDMDDMDEMDGMDDADEMPKKKMKKKMKNKGGKGSMEEAKIKSNDPSDGPMPGTDASGSMAADPMATSSKSDTMGRMRGPTQGRRGNMAPTASLPGIPGATHLYHVGSTGFFLDHPQHVTLTTEQRTALNRIKEKASLDRANSDRRIEDAEQDLWLLTAADTPDAGKIEARIGAIEKLRGDQRLASIRAVGEASKVLTSDQVAALLGTKPPAGSNPTDVGKPAPMKPMSQR